LQNLKLMRIFVSLFHNCTRNRFRAILSGNPENGLLNRMELLSIADEESDTWLRWIQSVKDHTNRGNQLANEITDHSQAISFHWHLNPPIWQTMKSRVDLDDISREVTRPSICPTHFNSLRSFVTWSYLIRTFHNSESTVIPEAWQLQILKFKVTISSFHLWWLCDNHNSTQYRK
jgi:hypothetical protein